MKYLALLLALALCGQVNAQCYVDPATGQMVCPAQAPQRVAATPVRTAVAAAVRPVRSVVGVYQSVRSVKASGNCTGAQSYGSTGSAAVQVVTYGSTGSAASSYMVYRTSGCNCPNCTCGPNCQCGVDRDVDGSVITSYGPLMPVQSSVQSANGVSAMGLLQPKKRSRQVIVEAADKAKAEGLIDASQAQAIKLAARSPRMLARMEDLILEKAQSSGAYSFALDRNGDVIASAIDWEAIGDFILKIAPIIFKLIEMFAVFEQAGDLQGMAMVEAKLDYLATIHWQARLAC